jgi:endonuclease/exonuclease/phosphatase family metal-dependent hydrolase
MPLRVMTWNVSYCQSSAKIDDIAAFIRQNNPDIVLLQEIATSGPLSGEIIGVHNGVQQQVELARKTGLPYSTFVRNGFDHNSIVGNDVLSRFPLTGSERLLLPNQDESSILKTQAVINGVVHHIYTMHPRGVIVPPNTRPNTDLAAEVLVQNVLALNPADMVIFGGDLNEAPDSYIANEGHLTETPAKLYYRLDLSQLAVLLLPHEKGASVTDHDRQQDTDYGLELDPDDGPQRAAGVGPPQAAGYSLQHRENNKDTIEEIKEDIPPSPLHGADTPLRDPVASPCRSTPCPKTSR